jgi:hypothetical protein
MAVGSVGAVAERSSTKKWTDIVNRQNRLKGTFFNFSPIIEFYVRTRKLLPWIFGTKLGSTYICAYVYSFIKKLPSYTLAGFDLVTRSIGLLVSMLYIHVIDLIFRTRIWQALNIVNLQFRART